jgi:hypothetical protein
VAVEAEEALGYPDLKTCGEVVGKMVGSELWRVSRSVVEVAEVDEEGLVGVVGPGAGCESCYKSSLVVILRRCPGGLTGWSVKGEMLTSVPVGLQLSCRICELEVARWVLSCALFLAEEFGIETDCVAECRADNAAVEFFDNGRTHERMRIKKVKRFSRLGCGCHSNGRFGVGSASFGRELDVLLRRSRRGG